MARRRERGLTLIELLIVTFILSVGLTGVASLFVAGLVSSRHGQRMSAATHEALRQIEHMRSAHFAGCTVSTDVFPPEEGYTIVRQNANLTGQVGFQIPDLPNGVGRIDIALYDPGTGTMANLKDVKVTITWQGGDPTGGVTVLHTLIANAPK